MPTDHSRLRELFIAACDLSEQDQGALINEQCADDPSLRDELKRLLRKDGSRGGILEDDDIIAGIQVPLDAGAARETPEHIGRYKVKRLLGEGGMGIVWLAEQENPKREVAIKVVRAGFLGRELVRRFELEAAVLGRLKHPGIAQIYEAGMFDDGSGGRPFFAMEYVEGEPLAAYIKARELGTRARLQLFTKICDAVHHAHQKGVVHRDLKPGNILVTDEGQPKILDFGVARATDSDLQVTTLQTDVGQLIGTLPYMSPEQVEGESHQLDTRSDVYALGVILYELLADRLPYDLKDRTITKAARVIVENDPFPLSSISRVYRGDLNTIALKALEKDPERRYQSAAELAEDVRRYLSDQPIAARPATTMYQFRKFARRNKAVVGGAAAVFLVLMAGIIGTAWGMLHAQAQRDEAQRQMRIAQATNDFLNDDLLGKANPNIGPGKDVLLREVLDQAAASIEERFLSEPLVHGSIRRTLFRSYFQLGEYVEAEKHALVAIPIFEQTYGEGDVTTVQLRKDLAYIYLQQWRLDESQQILLQALEAAQRELGPRHEEVASVRATLAVLLKRQGRLDEAEDHYRAAIQIMDSLGLQDDRRAIITRENLALLLSHRNQHAEAEAMLREVIEDFRRLSGLASPDLAWGLTNLSHVLLQQEEYDESEQCLREALEIRLELLGEMHPETLRTMYGIGLAQDDRGDHAEAERTLHRVLELQRQITSDDAIDVLNSMRRLGLAIERQGRLDEAAAWYRRALSIAVPAHGVLHSSSERNRSSLLRVFRESGNADELRAVHEEFHAQLRLAADSQGTDASVVHELATELLTCEVEELRDPAQALMRAEAAADMTGRSDPATLETLARALAENARTDEAIATQQRALDLLPKDALHRRKTLEESLDALRARSQSEDA